MSATTALTINSTPTAMATAEKAVEQHSLRRSAFLHLFPGLLIAGLYLVTGPLAVQAGYPASVAMLLGTLLVLLPFELGHLLREGRQRNGSWSLQGIVLNRASLPFRQYVLWVPAFLLVAYLIYALATPVDLLLIKWMSWLPEWFVLQDISQLARFSRPALWVTFWVSLILNGFVFPIVEELYFRGYLMPRLSRFGRWAPILNHALFTLYHFWQPYLYGTIFFGVLPLTLAVWWKRSIKLGILTHSALNLIGTLLIFGQLLG